MYITTCNKQQLCSLKIFLFILLLKNDTGLICFTEHLLCHHVVRNRQNVVICAKCMWGICLCLIHVTSYQQSHKQHAVQTEIKIQPLFTCKLSIKIKKAEHVYQYIKIYFIVDCRHVMQIRILGLLLKYLCESSVVIQLQYF